MNTIDDIVICEKCLLVYDQMEHNKCPLCGGGGIEVGVSETREHAIDRLRGQLQNCLNHLERCRRTRGRGSDTRKIDEVIESANKALYETLIR